MAKVKIQGNASGTGVLTVTAPNTSTDRTVTLPDATGTLLMTDGDGSSLTGLSHTPEGTAVLSTGETGGTKFLREDGDNTSSWQTVPAGGVDGIVSSADATAITIDSSENVGIGTGVPISELSIGSTSVSSYPTYSNPGSGVNQSFFASNINSGDSYNARLDIVSVAGNTDATNGGGSISFYTQPKVTPFAPIERLQLTRDGRGLSQFTAKAWINWNGTGTISINDSHNISSISDGGVGKYTININNNIANSNYAVSVGAGQLSTQGENRTMSVISNTRSAGAFTVFCESVADTAYDNDGNCAIVFGD